MTNKWAVDLSNEKFELEDPHSLVMVLGEVKKFGSDELDKAFFMAKILHIQAFFEGNKRTGFAVATASLRINGLEVSTDEQTWFTVEREVSTGPQTY